MTPRKPKPRKVEAWTIVGEEFYDAWPTRDEAEFHARANPPEGKWSIVHLIANEMEQDLRGCICNVEPESCPHALIKSFRAALAILDRSAR